MLVTFFYFYYLYQVICYTQRFLSIFSPYFSSHLVVPDVSKYFTFTTYSWICFNNLGGKFGRTTKNSFSILSNNQRPL